MNIQSKEIQNEYDTMYTKLPDALRAAKKLTKRDRCGAYVVSSPGDPGQQTRVYRVTCVGTVATMFGNRLIYIVDCGEVQ